LKTADIKLDAKDKKILYQLDVNARQPVSSIAKKVGLSREVVAYRIKNMERKGIIEGYYAAIDVAKLGYMYCRVYLNCPTISPQEEKEIMDYSMNHPSIGWVTAGHGRWNISFVAYVKSIAEFEKTYDDLRAALGKYFNEHYVSMAFKIYHFRHNYLFGTKDFSYAILGDAQRVKVDNKDLRILKMLAKDARVPALKLAKAANLTLNAASRRIKKLVREQIIIGFRPKINVALLGYEHYKIFLRFRNFAQKARQSIVSYLSFHPNVIYITKAFGMSDLEFEVIVKGSNELYEFMQGFLSRFSGSIAGWESILRYREIVSYLP